MFIIAYDQERTRRALEKLRAFLSEEVPCGSVQIMLAGEHVIGWFGCKPSDNFHVYTDGYIIGKVDFAEETSEEVIQHQEPMPVSIHPLLNSVAVKRQGENLIVEPFNISNVYYSGEVVSDMQLLIADLKELRPGQQEVSVFSVVGWLPGNMTLFSDVAKIPILYAYNLAQERLVQVKQFEYRENDDEAMLERLISIIPRGKNVLGISGGYDSRGVLGILHKAPQGVALLHWSGEEEDIVRQIAEEVGVPLTVAGEGDLASPLPSRSFTIMTDGQIYAGGGKFSRIRNQVSPDTLFHRGLFADSIFKNANSSAWKSPLRNAPIYERLIDHTYLKRSVAATVEGLAAFNQRTELKDFLVKELAFLKVYHPFEHQKEWGCWFYYINRSVRWAQTNAADLSFYCYPVFILSDVEATSYGISSSFWGNFGNERIRRINHNLLPQVTAPYHDDHPALPRRGIKRVVHKLIFEYGEKFYSWTKGQIYHRRTTNPTGVEEEVPTSSPLEFAQYYSAPNIAALMDTPNVRNYVKRSALTMHHVLEYLDTSPDAVS